MNHERYIAGLDNECRKDANTEAYGWLADNIDDGVFDKDDKEALKDAIKGKGKVKKVGKIRDNFAGNNRYVIILDNEDGYTVYLFSVANGLYNKMGPFVTLDSAISRADCYGLFKENKNVEDNLFKSIREAVGDYLYDDEEGNPVYDGGEEEYDDDFDSFEGDEMEDWAESPWGGQKNYYTADKLEPDYYDDGSGLGKPELDTEYDFDNIDGRKPPFGSFGTLKHPEKESPGMVASAVSSDEERATRQKNMYGLNMKNDPDEDDDWANHADDLEFRKFDFEDNVGNYRPELVEENKKMNKNRLFENILGSDTAKSFAREIQQLLEKYNANIYTGGNENGDDFTVVYFNDEDELYLWDNESSDGCPLQSDETLQSLEDLAYYI